MTVGQSTVDRIAPDRVATPEVADVLERYLADLERGAAPSREALLAAHPELAGELAPYLDGLLLVHGAALELRAAGAARGAFSALPAEGGTRQLGDFRIVREIGRGGMGIVYEAHQQSLNRRVALKILPFAAVLDERQIARFRNEAQAAAQLHHPHIVPVFAVGQEQGLHYYAMQYIDGQSLEEAIGELRRLAERPGELSTKACGGVDGSTVTLPAAGVLSTIQSVRESEFIRSVARLGKQAAEALAHAHECGVIHRDVKPSNLLIDHRSKLWVTDFGLARIQSDSGVTLTGDVVGTLRYMSPEQASGRAALVDGRTDVYSLGVTLYELLTLKPAFSGDDRQRLLSAIENDEPKPPRQINSAVPLDLETIVLEAMAKSREERYSSAQALADDLERFLAGKPTLARRPTLVDRAAKWARRHRSLVAVSAACAALLCIVSTVGMVLLAREQARTNRALAQSEDNARSARENFERAEQNFRQARLVVDQFGVRLADRLADLPGTDTVRQDVLTDTLRYYQTFVAEAADNPQLRHELALAHFRSGQIAAKLGGTKAALSEYEAGAKLLTELTAADVNNLELAAQLATTHNNVALLYAARGAIAAAQMNFEQAIAIGRRLVQQRPGEAAWSSRLAESLANFGMLFDQLGDPATAERWLAAAVDVLRPKSDATAADAQSSRNLAIALNNLSFVRRESDLPRATTTAREAVGILERLVDHSESTVSYQDDLALCASNLAALESRAGRTAEAIDWHERAAALQEQLARKSPAVVRHRSDLAISLNNLGVSYCRAERAADADQAFGRARELFTTLADDYPREPAYRASLAALLNNQALALAEAGRHVDAARVYPAAIDAQVHCKAESSPSAAIDDALSRMYFNYGKSLQAIGDFDRAATVALKRRDLWRADGAKLVGVAAELAAIRRAMRGADEDTTTEPIERQIVDTLRMASENHGLRGVDLAADERFADLRGKAVFRGLLDEDIQSSRNNGD